MTPSSVSQLCALSVTAECVRCPPAFVTCVHCYLSHKFVHSRSRLSVSFLCLIFVFSPRSSVLQVRALRDTAVCVLSLLNLRVLTHILCSTGSCTPRHGCVFFLYLIFVFSATSSVLQVRALPVTAECVPWTGLHCLPVSVVR